MRLSIALAVLVLVVVHAPMAQNNLGEVVIVTNAEGGDQFPDVAYNSQGNNYLVVWEHIVQGDVFEIQGVILNGSTGQPVGTPAVLLPEDPGYQAPEVVYNSTANEFALIARNRETNAVVLQRISTAGQPVGDAVQVGNSSGPIFDAAGRARVAGIAYNSTENKYFLALTPGEQPGPMIVLPDGTEDVAVTPFGRGTNPTAAWSSVSNVYLMAWEDREQRETGGENLSAQLISAAGDPIGDILFLRDQDFAEESPRVAYNAEDDEFLVIWDERIGFREGGTTQTDLIGQIVGADGQLVSQPINIELSNAYVLRQDVEYSPALDRYLVVWKGDEGGKWEFANIYGRYVNRDGTLAGAQFLIFDGGNDDTDEGDSQQYFDESKQPAVALNQSGNFLVVWEEAGATRDPDARNINARFVTGGGTDVTGWDLFE